MENWAENAGLWNSASTAERVWTTLSPHEERMQRFGQSSSAASGPFRETVLDYYDTDRAPSPTSIRGLSRRHSHSSLTSIWRMPPRSPGEDLGSFSAPNRLEPLHSPVRSAQQQFFDDLPTMSPLSALTHPGFCQNLTQGETLKATFAAERRSLAERYRQIVRTTVFQQFENSRAVRPQTDVEGSEVPGEPPHLDEYEAWHRARRSISIKALLCLPRADGTLSPHTFVNQTFGDMLFTQLRHDGVIPQRCHFDSRVELPALSSEKRNPEQLKSFPPLDMGVDFEWFDKARLNYRRRQHTQLLFEPSQFWAAYDVGSRNLAFPSWMFEAPFSKFFEHLGKTFLQTRFEASRLSGIFSLEHLKTIFAAARLDGDEDDEAYDRHLEVDKYQFIKAKRACVDALNADPNTWGSQEGQSFLWSNASQHIYEQQDALANWHRVRADGISKQVDCLIDVLAFLHAGSLQIDQYDEQSQKALSNGLSKYYTDQMTEIINGSERTF